MLRLLSQLKESMPAPVVNKIFTQMAQDMASGYKSEVDHLPLEQRLDLIKKLLSSEGFMVEWEKHGESYQIRESNCPYYHVGQNHPEVCSVDQTLISTLLAIPAQKIQCMLHGDAQCVYLISNDLPILEKQT